MLHLGRQLRLVVVVVMLTVATAAVNSAWSSRRAYRPQFRAVLHFEVVVRFGLVCSCPSPLFTSRIKRRPVPTQHFEHGGRDTIRSVRSLAYAFSPAALRILSLLSNQFRARLGTPCDRGGGSGEKAAVEGYI